MRRGGGGGYTENSLIKVIIKNEAFVTNFEISNRHS